MCGISAIFAPDGSGSPMELLSMTRAVLHRGPDDGGLVLFRQDHPQPCVVRDRSGLQATVETLRNAPPSFAAGLGHRRLSILDLSDAGHQPMSCDDGRYHVVYNGEIYNHLEVRRELEALGYRFKSHSDTEVLLAAYKEWRRDCLARFNGMFAFVIYDRVENRVFVARDRFGVKPLYYWRSPQGAVCFASEIKQFLQLPGWRSILNHQRAYDFLAWSLSDHTRETMFADVFQVLPGYWVEFEVDKAAITRTFRAAENVGQRWYQLTASPVPSSLDQAAEEFSARFAASIELRLRSDVPVGANLSGGLDSSSIVCLLNGIRRLQGIDSPFSTLSAHSSVAAFNETSFIEEVLHVVDADPLFVQTSLEDLQRELPSMVWHQDEPFSSTSIFAEWCIYRGAARSGIKVMLGGQGADEQLAGYPEYVGLYYRKWLLSAQIRALVEDMRAARNERGASKFALIARLANTLMPQMIRQPLRRAMGVSNARPKWLGLAKLKADPCDPYEKFGFRNASVREASRSQIESTNLPMQLRWEDRDSMAHSVESRTPFLDYRLVEFLHGLPDEYRYWRGESKRILRFAMRGTVPDKVLDRRDKMGFVTPEEVWVRGEGAEYFRKMVRQAADAGDGIIAPNAVDYFDDVIEGRARFSHALWRVVSFGAWADRFSVAV